MKSLLLVVAAVVCALSTVTTTQAQIPVRRAGPVVKGPISVENTSIAVGQIPGVFLRHQSRLPIFLRDQKQWSQDV